MAMVPTPHLTKFLSGARRVLSRVDIRCGRGRCTISGALCQSGIGAEDAPLQLCCMGAER